MPFWLLIVLAASQAARAADTVPNFNIEPTCRAATAASPGRSNDICLKDEREARAKLEQDWANYPAKDRASCLRLSTLDGQPSYVEVLTCVEIAAEARATGER